MTDCCGEKRGTPFCPMCGKRMREPHPLAALLAHCQQQVEAMRTRIATLHERLNCEERTGKRDRIDGRIAGSTATLEKWEGWIAALEQAIAREEQV